MVEVCCSAPGTGRADFLLIRFGRLWFLRWFWHEYSAGWTHWLSCKSKQNYLFIVVSCDLVLTVVVIVDSIQRTVARISVVAGGDKLRFTTHKFFGVRSCVYVVLFDIVDVWSR